MGLSQQGRPHAQRDRLGVPGTPQRRCQHLVHIACGYEDQNDLDTLREDPLLKVLRDSLPESGGDLASRPPSLGWRMRPRHAPATEYDFSKVKVGKEATISLDRTSLRGPGERPRGRLRSASTTAKEPHTKPKVSSSPHINLRSPGYHSWKSYAISMIAPCFMLSFSCSPSLVTREQLLDRVAGVSDAVLRAHQPGDLPRPAGVFRFR
jgi:hypothetical protein